MLGLLKVRTVLQQPDGGESDETGKAVFTLKAPIENERFGEMDVQGRFPTLDEAIEAAINADLDLETTMIEKHGGQHSVNAWIALRTAGGNSEAG